MMRRKNKKIFNLLKLINILILKFKKNRKNFIKQIR